MQKSTSYDLKKWLFGLISLIAFFSAEVTLISTTSRFLSRGLINMLPMLLFVVSAAAIVNFLFSLVLSKKLNAAQSLCVSLIMLMALTAVNFYLKDNEVVYLFISVLITRLGFIIFDTSITNLASSYVNQRQAKSFLPFVRGVMDGAVLLASAFLYAASIWTFSYEPLMILILAIAAMVLLILVICKVFDPIKVEGVVDDSRGFSAGVKDSIKFVFSESRLFGLVTWLFVFLGIGAVMFVFVYNQVFANNLSGEDLTRFLAITNFVAVFLRGIFDLIFLKKSLFRFGVANLLVVYPWIMFLILSVLVISSGNLMVAAALYVFHVFSYYSYVTVATQALFGLTPSRINQPVYFFVKGVIPALCALIAALLMVGLLALTNNPFWINFSYLLISGGTLLFALAIKKEYQHTLTMALAQPDNYLKGNAVDLLGENVQKESGEKLLRKLLLDKGEDLLIRQKAVTSLVEIGNVNSIRELLLILDKDDNLRLRFYAAQAINKLLEKVSQKRFSNMTVTKLIMVDVFNKIYQEDLPLPLKLEVNQSMKIFGFDVLLEFYKTHFETSTDMLKASIIEALAVADDRGLITLLEPFLDSRDLGIRTAAISALWRFQELRGLLMSKTIAIFAVKDFEHRVASLKLISALKLMSMKDYVLDLIPVPDQKLSVLAIITAINLDMGGGVKVLIRKIIKYAMTGDVEMVEYMFKKFYQLNPINKKKFVSELRALNQVNFSILRDVFNKSEQYFDLELTAVFTS